MPKITSPVQFIGPGLKVGDKDITDAAAKIGCSPEVVRTVLSVEAAGSGFFADGRPKILYEAHIFGRLTKGKFNETHPALSAAKWDRSLYVGGAAEYDRLLAAMQLDREAALASCSWGLFQILGTNRKACGYETVDEFVAAQVAGEPEQLRGFVNFIIASGLADELRDKRWADFARAYNGPGYAANKYDVKLAANFNKLIAAAEHVADDDRNEPNVSSPRQRVMDLQIALNAHGARLTVDGYMGGKTSAAIVAFQKAKGLTPDGVPGPLTRKALGLAD